MKNFLNISDLSPQDLRLIVDEAKSRKAKRTGLTKSAIDEDSPLKGRSMIMIFEKPSTRTRISFDIAIKQLGVQQSHLILREFIMAKEMKV